MPCMFIPRVHFEEFLRNKLFYDSVVSNRIVLVAACFLFNCFSYKEVPVCRLVLAKPLLLLIGLYISFINIIMFYYLEKICNCM